MHSCAKAHDLRHKSAGQRPAGNAGSPAAVAARPQLHLILTKAGMAVLIIMVVTGLVLERSGVCR